MTKKLSVDDVLEIRPKKLSVDEVVASSKISAEDILSESRNIKSSEPLPENLSRPGEGFQSVLNPTQPPDSKIDFENLSNAKASIQSRALETTLERMAGEEERALAQISADANPFGGFTPASAAPTGIQGFSNNLRIHFSRTLGALGAQRNPFTGHDPKVGGQLPTGEGVGGFIGDTVGPFTDPRVVALSVIGYGVTRPAAILAGIASKGSSSPARVIQFFGAKIGLKKPAIEFITREAISGGASLAPVAFLDEFERTGSLKDASQAGVEGLLLGMVGGPLGVGAFQSLGRGFSKLGAYRQIRVNNATARRNLDLPKGELTENQILEAYGNSIGRTLGRFQRGVEKAEIKQLDPFTAKQIMEVHKSTDLLLKEIGSERASNGSKFMISDAAEDALLPTLSESVVGTSHGALPEVIVTGPRAKTRVAVSDDPLQQAGFLGADNLPAQNAQGASPTPLSSGLITADDIVGLDRTGAVRLAKPASPASPAFIAADTPVPYTALATQEWAETLAESSTARVALTEVIALGDTPSIYTPTSRNSGHLYVRPLAEVSGELSGRFRRGLRAIGQILDEGIYSNFTDDMINVVRRQGRSGPLTAEQAERVILKNKEVLGEVAPLLRETLETIGGRKGATDKVTSSWKLQEVDWVSLDDIPSGLVSYGEAKVMKALEGRMDLDHLPATARKWVERQRLLNMLTGEIAERAKLVQRVPAGKKKARRLELEKLDDNQLSEMWKQINKGGKDPLNREEYIKVLSHFQAFKATPEGKVALRAATSELSALYQVGEGPVWDAYVIAIMKANNWSRKKSQRVLARYTKKNYRRTNMEIPREIPNHPTHIRVRDRTGDQVISLLYTDPFNYTAQTTKNFATRIGFVSEYGQGIKRLESGSGMLKNAREVALLGGVRVKSFDNLVRTLSGLNLVDPVLTPGSAGHTLARRIGDLASMQKSLMLTRAWVPNIPEFLGNIQAFGGIRRVLLALKDMKNPRVVALELERLGISAVDVTNLTLDRSRTLQSFTRIFGQEILTLFPTRPIWRFQELHGAAVGLRFAMDLKQLRSGRFNKQVDFWRLRWLGYSKPKAEKLIQGRGSNSEYIDVARRFAARSNSTNFTLPAEESTVLNNRKFKALMWFFRYPMMKARSLTKVSKIWVEGFENVRKNPTKQNWDQFWGATILNARYHAGTAAQGSAAMFILEAVMGGMDGVRLLASEATRGDTLGEKAKSLATHIGKGYAFAQAGPLIHALVKIESTSSLDDAWRFSAGLGVAADGISAIVGLGTFSGLSTSERMTAYLDRYTAISAPAKRWLAWTGLMSGDNELDLALRGYWRFRRQELGVTGRYVQGVLPEEDKEFRRLGRKAYKEIARNGPWNESKDVEINNFIREMYYVEGKSPHDVARTLRSRRVLSSLKPEENAKLYQRFQDAGLEKLYNKLEAHDKLLDFWADSVLERAPKRR